MKRSPMPRRSSPLQRSKPLERAAAPDKPTEPGPDSADPDNSGRPASKPKRRLRPRSRKAEAAYRVRRPMLKALTDMHPYCVRPGCNRFAADGHEPLTRARGGSITDPDNVVLLCRPCHDELGTEPAWAYDLGLLRHSWDAGVRGRTTTNDRTGT
ncbi:hypothetical protein ABT299_11690 [Spirillospora sp. NPDC000708]